MENFYAQFRDIISTLRQYGHTNCDRYPWGMACNEHNRIMRRENAKMASEAALLHAAIGAVLGGPDHFNKLLKELTDGG